MSENMLQFKLYFLKFFFSLWLKVSDAFKAQDQNLATEEKSIIEARQRESCFERKSKHIEYQPKLFTYDPETKQWIYNYSE